MRTRLPLFFLLAFSTNFFGQIGFDENIVTGYSYSTVWAQVVKAADLDGDGDLDVIAYGTGLNWYENVDGLGNFGEKKIISAEIATSSNQNQILYTADFDNDGDIDVMSSKDNKLSVYKNSDGLGTFTVMQLFTLGSSYPALSALPMDMNADGDIDLLVFYSNNSSGPTQCYISWFENDGTGTFGAQQIINNNNAQLFSGSHLFADDMDGDGDPDIILGYRNYNKIAWFKNNGNATFNAPVTISTVAGGINSILTADVDNDGDKDIVATQQTDNQAVWYKNLDGLGNFTDENVFTSNAQASQTTFVSDINNDGLNDILYTGTNEIGWIANNGSGNFGNTQVITNKAYDVRSITMADLDGDGIKDLISASYADDKIAWYKNLGNTNFGRQLVIARRIDTPNNVYPGDFDGDNDIDILVNSIYDSKLTWFENVNGIGFYGKEHLIYENITTGYIMPYSYPADFDGDGDLDIVTVRNSILFWYENDGQGNFNVEHLIDSTSSATIIRSADIDGDGKYDIVCGVYSADQLSWYKNIGSGNFSTEQLIANLSGTNGALTSLEIADMDGDNDMDIIASSDTWTMWYFKNTNGLGTFTLVSNLTFRSNIAVYPADIDGDGDKDIVAVSSLGGGGFDAVVWFENTTGLGNFNTKHPISTLSIHGESIHAADIDNDGDMDVITGGGTTTEPQFAWYPNNGNGTFGTRQIIQNLLNNIIDGKCVTTSDIDNDGDLDILTTFSNSTGSNIGKASVFENLGALGNTIQGKVLIDSDSNGCTSTDLKGSNLMVISDNGTHSFSTFTDQTGAYHVNTTAGNFNTAITSQLPDYFVSNPTSYTSNFAGLNNTALADFCVAPVGIVNDLDISLYPLNTPSPGFPVSYRVVYKNKGTTVLNGTINFEYNNNKMSFISANQTVSAQTNNTLTFDFTNLHLFETRIIEVKFGVFSPPVTNIYDQLLTTVTVNPVSGDATQDDNTFILNQIVVASYDPNDITCLEGNQVLIADADQYLHYIIRFQNTGTAEAINVTIKNILDNKLDWTSMQLESLSHSGRVEINDGSEVKFIFNNIHLPDSTTNEGQSHGFIAYKVKPRSNVVVGDIVNNSADIFFDFNPAIVTNTTATQFVDTLSVAENDNHKFTIYPNPTTGLLNIQGNTMIDKISVIDINGRIFQEIHFTTSTLFAQLDITNLKTGIYFLKINSNQENTNMKIIKR